MNCNPTLTAEEFKTIHNALCQIRSVQGSLEGVVREEITTRLEKAIANMEQGLSNAYRQDNEVFDTRNKHFTHVQSAHDLQSVWSLYEVADLYAMHPHAGATKIKYGDQYTHIDTPRTEWIDLYIAANDAIKASGDQHHIFIEAFTPIAGEPGVLRLTCGS
jgi:hypothetical protein